MISPNAHQTLSHIRTVQNYLSLVCSKLIERGINHDTSKLQSPEEEIFDKYTDSLHGLTYGSEEYNRILLEMKPAIDHHYANNTHHPEFYGFNGIHKMSLLDLVEMVCDWKAATERHKDGDLLKSIEINQARFGYDDNLKMILRRTAFDLWPELFETPK